VSRPGRFDAPDPRPFLPALSPMRGPRTRGSCPASVVSMAAERNQSQSSHRVRRGHGILHGPDHLTIEPHPAAGERMDYRRRRLRLIGSHRAHCLRDSRRGHSHIASEQIMHDVPGPVPTPRTFGMCFPPPNWPTGLMIRPRHLSHEVWRGMQKEPWCQLFCGLHFYRRVTHRPAFLWTIVAVWEVLIRQ